MAIFGIVALAENSHVSWTLLSCFCFANARYPAKMRLAKRRHLTADTYRDMAGRGADGKLIFAVNLLTGRALGIQFTT
jgi:hypothetical protein